MALSGEPSLGNARIEVPSLDAGRDIISPAVWSMLDGWHVSICPVESLLYISTRENPETKVLLATQDELKSLDPDLVKGRLEWVQRKFGVPYMPVEVPMAAE